MVARTIAVSPARTLHVSKLAPRLTQVSLEGAMMTEMLYA
jgi:hypothetical protein